MLTKYLKQTVKKIAYFFIECLVPKRAPVDSKTLLLIRLDAIGDYVLFRNFIETLKTSDIYGDHNIVFVGNAAYRDLFEELDSQWVVETIWINRYKFSHSLIYRYKLLKKICRNYYAVAIQPTYSRERYYGDAVISNASAKIKIGNSGNLSNMSCEEKRIADKFYHQLLPASNKMLFEFDRNREFFQSLLGVNLKSMSPCINTIASKKKFDLPAHYAVIFLGASTDAKRWRGSYYAQIAEFLKDEYRFNIVVCGANDACQQFNDFAKYAQFDYCNLVGQTTLVELMYIIAGAKLMLANDTGAAHMAAALSIKNVFVISNGNGFGRFFPYPIKFGKAVHTIQHPSCKDMGEQEMAVLFANGSRLKVDDIQVIDVKQIIAQTLSMNTA